MVEDKDVEALNKRIDCLAEHFEKHNREVMKKLIIIQNDAGIIKNTCRIRGENCAKQVIELDKNIRGNGKDGLVTRITTLEQQRVSKEKFAYLIIGILGTATISVIVAFISRLISN